VPLPSGQQLCAERFFSNEELFPYKLTFKKLYYHSFTCFFTLNFLELIMNAKRLFVAAAMLVTVSSAAFAQSPVAGTPRGATTNDSLIITYTPARDRAGMTGVTDVYVYTTAKEPGAANWQDDSYRVAAWGDVGTVGKLKLARQMNSTHILRIVPTVRAFYGVPAGKNLDSILFVFRAADGMTQGNDIVFGLSRVTSVKEDVFASTANYPNPASNVANISFGLKKAGNVTLKIFNAQGSEVATLLNGSPMTGNSLNIASWNCDDAKGGKVANGAYFYRLSVDGVSETGSILVNR
jgi:hypothetical protein